MHFGPNGVPGDPDSAHAPWQGVEHHLSFTCRLDGMDCGLPSRPQAHSILSIDESLTSLREASTLSGKLEPAISAGQGF